MFQRDMVVSLESPGKSTKGQRKVFFLLSNDDFLSTIFCALLFCMVPITTYFVVDELVSEGQTGYV